jgi:type II secretion system protein G
MEEKMKKGYNPEQSRKGFTLIELLVVIAIIGILASMALVALSGTRAKARDANRKSDLRSIKAALEVYYSDKKPNAYKVPTTNPAALDTAANAVTATGLDTTYIKTFPIDPTNSATTPYVYGTTATGTDYAVFANLENANDGEIKTAGPGTLAIPTGYANCYWVQND